MPDLSVSVQNDHSLRAQLLELWPSLAEDSETLIDTLDGVSSFEEEAIAVLRAAIEREAQGKALGELIEGMTGRKRRLEEGARTMRLMVLHAMSETGRKKLSAPDFTASVGIGKPKVLVTDETAVPFDLCKVSTIPNKTEIAKALADGREVPGVTLSNPEPFLTVRKS